MGDRVHRKVCRILCRDGNAICRVDEEGNVKKEEAGSTDEEYDPAAQRASQQYEHTTIDEGYFSVLRDLCWNRDDGIVELMPVAVVHVERTS